MLNKNKNRKSLLCADFKDINKLKDCKSKHFDNKRPLIHTPLSLKCFSPEKGKSIAFTLSEVLITLVIIGVVAAITVPNIIAHQREIATVEKVKKFYSTMSNAVKRAIVDTGLQVDEWNYGGGDSFTRKSSVNFMNYIRPYLIIAADDCGTTGKCYTDEYIKTLKGLNWFKYYALDNHYKAALNDGSIFWFRTAGEGCKATASSSVMTILGIDTTICADVWYDVNGTKGPNTYGKDVFIFSVTPDGFVASVANDCNYKSTGYGCSGYILKNNNMDYLH